ncbi:MAG TPA: ABC transporter permease subunit [Candidatus Goldiibacteriota bacterium]|nr:ABC transporter permease subunit [Candidatus Goldiibacteriota bacterium]
MRRVMAVAEYIFKQSFRNRILNILIIFAVFAIGFSLVVSELAQESEIKMITDFGLFAISIFAFLTLVLSITVQMFEETELKTLLVVMVKPIKRHEYIAGKFIGIAGMILMNVILMLATLMLILKYKGADPWNIQLIVSAGSSFLAASILTAAAMLLSVISTSVPGCVIFLFFVYVLGHLTVHLKSMAQGMENGAARIAIDFIYYAFPNLELFNLKDKIYSPEGLFSGYYLSLMLGYAAAYSAVLLLAASMIFEKKEFY